MRHVVHINGNDKRTATRQRAAVLFMSPIYAMANTVSKD